MKKTILLAFTVIAIMLTSNGCKKPKDGATGPQGPAGTNGTNGINGNSNVETGVFAVSSWSLNGVIYQATVSLPAITQHIVDKGAVLVYYGGNTSTNWLALPITIYPTKYYSESIAYAHYIGTVLISVYDSDLTSPAYPGTINFKIVVIDGKRWGHFPKEIISDYQSVKKYLQLAD